MVGILVSFWDALFSGAMLVSGSLLSRENRRHFFSCEISGSPIWHVFQKMCPTKCWMKGPINYNLQVEAHEEWTNHLFIFGLGVSQVTPLKTKISPNKWLEDVGRWHSFWNGPLFRGHSLVFGGLHLHNSNQTQLKARVFHQQIRFKRPVSEKKNKQHIKNRWYNCKIQAHRIHVWYIYLHLVDYYGKRR